MNRREPERAPRARWLRPRRIGVGAVLVLGLLVQGRMGAAEQASGRLAIVVHPSNPIVQLTKEQVKKIFLRKQARWEGCSAIGGKKILAIDLPMRDAARSTFSDAVLGASVEKIKKYWIAQRLKGGARPPLTVRNAEAAAKIVARKPNAIGYLPLELAKKEKVKVVLEVGE